MAYRWLRAAAALALIAAATGCGGGAAASIGPGSGGALETISSAPTATPAPTPTTGPGGCTVPAPPVQPPPGDGVSFLTCFHLTGLVTVSGGFDDISTGGHATSCADYARGTATVLSSGAAPEVIWTLPDPTDDNIQVSGGALSFDLSIGPYSGPGRYPATDVPGAITVGPSDFSDTPVAGSAQPAPSLSADLRADGSGTFTFSNWTPLTGTGTESGSIEWTCVNN